MSIQIAQIDVYVHKLYTPCALNFMLPAYKTKFTPATKEKSDRPNPNYKYRMKGGVAVT
jgi:hypothetical protein